MAKKGEDRARDEIAAQGRLLARPRMAAGQARPGLHRLGEGGDQDGVIYIGAVA